MEIKDIEKLVDIFRDASITELTVSAGGVTVRLQKPLVQAAAPALVCRKETPAPVSAPVSKSAPPEELAASDTYIVAPMVGIFHRIDAVDGIGGVVKAGQVVGAIESMKLMNDIVSECDGIIAEALVEDGMPVEFGQALFRLEQA